MILKHLSDLFFFTTLECNAPCYLLADDCVAKKKVGFQLRSSNNKQGHPERAIARVKRQKFHLIFQKEVREMTISRHLGGVFQS